MKTTRSILGVNTACSSHAGLRVSRDGRQRPRAGSGSRQKNSSGSIAVPVVSV
jgi:hypothetical protein